MIGISGLVNVGYKQTWADAVEHRLSWHLRWTCLSGEVGSVPSCPVFERVLMLALLGRREGVLRFKKRADIRS